jgi:hypothetical protein
MRPAKSSSERDSRSSDGQPVGLAGADQVESLGERGTAGQALTGGSCVGQVGHDLPAAAVGLGEQRGLLRCQARAAVCLLAVDTRVYSTTRSGGALRPLGSQR